MLTTDALTSTLPVSMPGHSTQYSCRSEVQLSTSSLRFVLEKQ